MTHPAERIKKVPTINKLTKKKFGLPFVSMINEVKVGQSNRAVPIGLSALINRTKFANFLLSIISKYHYGED